MNGLNRPLCVAATLLALLATRASVAAPDSAGAESFAINGEESLPLDGVWKFKALEPAAVADSASNAPLLSQPGDIVVDSEDAGAAEVRGKWTRSTWSEGGSLWKGSYLVAKERAPGDAARVIFKPAIAKAQAHEVFVNWSRGERDSDVKVIIRHAGGSKTVEVDQAQGGGRWVSLGRFPFAPGAGHSVTVEADGAGAQVVADAVLLRPVSAVPAAAAEPAASAQDELFSPTVSDAKWDSMAVPGNWDTTNAYAHHVGKAWYRRSLTPPSTWRGSRVRLRFEAVYHDADVYLNGQRLGSHSGGYTPFEFDVTGLLRFGRPNLLAVRADNTYRRGAWWAWGGISRPVRLVRNADVRIVEQHAWAEPDLATGTAQVMVRQVIENAAASERAVTVRSQISLGGVASAPSFSRAVRVPPRGRQVLEWSVALPAERVRLWHFDRPSLYELQSGVAEGSKYLHRKSDRFGIRKVEVTRDALLLNGEAIRVPGFNRVHDHRAWGSTEPQHLVRADIDRMKRAGAVMMRVMHGPQSPDLLRYADEKGLLLFCEIPVWGGVDPRIKEAGYPTTRRWLSEMIGRDFNHPSIIGWSVGNELTGHFDYVRDMIAYVRRDLDPHRLLAYVSYTGAREGVNASNDPITFSDLTLHNNYGSLSGQAPTLRERWPSKPIFFTEFGAGQIGLGLDARVPGLESRLDGIRDKNPFVIGASLWTFNDYRSSFSGTPASEDRAWGVVNNWRQPKRAFEQVARQYSPVRALSVQNLVTESPSLSLAHRVDGRATIRLEPRGAQDFPAYTLRGYRLRWDVRTPDDSAVAGGLLELPDIKPGDAPLTPEVAWSMSDSMMQGIVVSLISPTGYVVHESRQPLAVPIRPRILAVLPGDGSVRVVFEPVAGADEYKILHGATGQVLAESTGATIEPQMTIGGLSNGTRYEFAVVALNAKGRSVLSAQASGTPSGQALPPIVWKAVPLDGGFMVGYSVEKEDRTFSIEYGTRPGQLSRSLTGLELKGAASVMGLQNGTPIFFRIRRAGDYGQSGWSQVLSVTPNGQAPPPTPRILGAVRGRGTASLRFEPVEQAARYLIRYGAAGSAALKTLAVEAAWIEQATVGGLDDARDYSLSIAAVGEHGTSRFSAPVTLGRAAR